MAQIVEVQVLDAKRHPRTAECRSDGVGVVGENAIARLVLLCTKPHMEPSSGKRL